VLRFASLGAVPGFAHGVSTRAGGVSVGAYAALNLGRSTGDRPEAVEENRRRVAATLGFTTLVTPRQVHGARVAAIATPESVPGEADALATDRPGLLLGVLGADCPGVLLVDPRRRALAVAHAGWRGTVAGVLEAAIHVLVSRYRSRPEDLLAAVGPGISQAAYEVGPEVADALARAAPGAAACIAAGRDDRRHVDLSGVLRLQLLDAGVPPTAIETSPLCTRGEPALLFSHRRDGALAGRHALVAGWSA
jgi:polyphenol oxidase